MALISDLTFDRDRRRRLLPDWVSDIELYDVARVYFRIRSKPHGQLLVNGKLP